MWQSGEGGGWDRIRLIVDDIESEAQRLRLTGLKFQILLEDPAGNPIEVFQPPIPGNAP
jgi:hypothetical protein